MLKRTIPKTLLIISVVSVMIVFACTAEGGVIYVDATKNGDGSSWADACKYLRDGLSMAAGGDEIWVARECTSLMRT
jgi:hypothetical protein